MPIPDTSVDTEVVGERRRRARVIDRVNRGIGRAIDRFRNRPGRR
jgi:hypothetical protein